jgi:hypothetical protein
MHLSISTCRGWILAVVVLMAIGLSGAGVALAQDPPQIVDQPDDADVCDGGAATFSVVASGDAPLEYQWYEEGIAIWGADEASYTIDPVGPGAEGVFHVLVSNPYGSAESDHVTLTVHGGPVITLHPQDTTVCEDESLTLWVVADGLGTLEYQWRKGGVDLTGEESDTLVIDPVATGDAGEYDVVVTDDCGSITSSTATVTVRVAPSIVTDPDDAFACLGDSAMFEVVADGSAPLLYQWYHNGAPVGGATDSTYTINAVGLIHAGNYYVVVRNDCDMVGVQSETATLTVNIGPTITGPPESQVACSGAAEVTFSVTVTGSDPLTYQWRKYEAGVPVDIPGATGSSYTIVDVDLGDAGDYDVVVNNLCGEDTSDVATLVIVEDVPEIVDQPQDAARCDNGTDSITFSVTATPPDDLAYQWYHDDVLIPGAEADTYEIPVVTVADAGEYYVIVSNPCGDSFSDAAVLVVVDEGPGIVDGPESDTICEGDPVTFTVTAEGPEPLSYQWYGPTGLIPGATQASYTIDPVALDDAGNYRVEVSNPCATVSSAQAALTVIDEAPGIGQQPDNQELCEGETVTFSVVPTGDPPFEYQWRKDGADLTGEESDTLVIDPVTSGDAGEYSVMVTNACGSAESDAATLTVNTAVVITQQPASQELCEKEPVAFSVQVSGTEPYGYQWYKDGGEIAGATESTYSIASITPANAGSYQVMVSNPCSVGVYSDPATLTVFLNPTITQQPAAPELCVGDAVTLSVVATGTEPFTYQWYKDGQPIAGATDSTFTIDPLSAADSGEYHVVVTNLCDQDVSDPVTLVVDEPPLIVTQPAPAIIARGQTHVFCVAVTGTAPFEYQWRKDGVNIAGATANCYEASEAGMYACVVTNRCDVVVSNAAQLTIAPRLIISAIADPPGVRLGNPSTLTAAADRGLAPYTYLWSTGATTAAIVVTPTETVYSVTASDALGQTATTDVSVVVAAPLTVQTRASAYMLWPGESSTLTASVLTGGLVPFTFVWSTGATTASIIVSPTSDTTYYVMVTDSLGQTGTASVTITVNEQTEGDQGGGKQSPSDGSGDGDQTDGGGGGSDQGGGTGDGEEDQGGQVTPTAGLCPVSSLTMISLLVAGVCWARGAKPRRRQ